MNTLQSRPQYCPTVPGASGSILKGIQNFSYITAAEQMSGDFFFFFFLEILNFHPHLEEVENVRNAPAGLREVF